MGGKSSEVEPDQQDRHRFEWKIACRADRWMGTLKQNGMGKCRRTGAGKQEQGSRQSGFHVLILPGDLADRLMNRHEFRAIGKGGLDLYVVNHLGNAFHDLIPGQDF